VNTLAFLPHQAKGLSIIVGCSQSVYLSADSGATWELVNAGLPNTEFRHFLVLPLQGVSGTSSGLTIFASTDNGVYVSTDYGVSWTDVSAGLTNRYIGGLAASDTYLFAATQGGVVWRRPLADLVTSARRPINEVPDGFHLQQNYPNPFNPKTGVRFQVAGVREVGARDQGSGASVKLTVYDLLGREVAVLVNERKAPGSYEVSFDGSGLASGVYIYRMTAGSFATSRKMILVK
jgi:hypothetical protein